jgi:hypothetical protein
VVVQSKFLNPFATLHARRYHPNRRSFSLTRREGRTRRVYPLASVYLGFPRRGKGVVAAPMSGDIGGGGKAGLRLGSSSFSRPGGPGTVTVGGGGGWSSKSRRSRVAVRSGSVFTAGGSAGGTVLSIGRTGAPSEAAGGRSSIDGDGVVSTPEERPSVR